MGYKDESGRFQPEEKERLKGITEIQKDIERILGQSEGVGRRMSDFKVIEKDLLALEKQVLKLRQENALALQELEQQIWAIEERCRKLSAGEEEPVDFNSFGRSDGEDEEIPF